MGILIPADNSRPLVLQGFTSLEDYQQAVGGWIEGIPADEDDTSFFINTVAKLISLEVNRHATIHWLLQLHPTVTNGVLCGDVILVGPADERGDTLDVPESLQHLLFVATAFTVAVELQGATPGQFEPQVFGDYFDAGAWGLVLSQRRADVKRIRVIAHS